jgi:tetratricopeptide (TPR) repeat protein
MTCERTPARIVMCLTLLAFSGFGPALGQGINPNSYFQPMMPHYHFDYWSRCSDRRVDLQRRIESCKSMLGTGRGATDDVQIWGQIGDAYLEAGKYDSALEAFDQARHAHGIYPRDVLVRERWQEALVLSGHYESAIADADVLVKEAPDNAGFLNQRCWLRAIAGKELDIALADCNEALKRTPTDADVFDSRGLVNFKLNKLNDATADYDSALKLKSNLETSLYMRGLIKRRNGNAAGGDDDIVAARKTEPLIAERFASYGVSP